MRTVLCKIASLELFARSLETQEEEECHEWALFALFSTPNVRLSVVLGVS